MSLADRFFAEIRDVRLGAREALTISPDDLATIAEDLGQRAAFRTQFLNQTQDPELRRLILNVLQANAGNFDDKASEAAHVIETIDKYYNRLSQGAAIGGTGTILYGAVASGSVALVGPLVLAAGGIAGLGLCVLGRSRMASRQRTAVRKARIIREMATELENGG